MNKFVLFAIIGFVFIVAVGFLLIPASSIEASSQAEHQFTIEDPMRRVRKILVRTNAVKKIVAMADAELLDQEWLNMKFDIDKPILKRDWNVNGDGILSVRFNDAYLGSHEITLQQDASISPDRLHVTNELQQPSGPVQNYRSVLTLTPDDSGNAHFKCSLDLRIKTTANWFTESVVRSKIEAAAAEALKMQEKAIRTVVADHADELIILPDSGDE